MAKNSDAPSKAMQDLQKQETQLNKQLQDIQMQKVRQRHAENRAATQATLTPEQLKAQAADDALTLKVFSTDDGKAFLAMMAKDRPALCDAINESMTRATTKTA